MLKISIDKYSENVEVTTDLKDFVLTFDTIKRIIEQTKESTPNPGELVTFELDLYKPSL